VLFAVAELLVPVINGLCLCVCVGSTALCDDLWQRDDDLPADVFDVSALPRDAQQHQGIHEDSLRSKISRRTSDRLRRVHVVTHERH